MSNLNRHPVRRTAAGILAGALALSGAVAAATPANALPQFDLIRLAGADRYETAAVIARDAFPQGSGTVILASGEDRNFPDALAGNYLAGKLNAPILLTASGSLSSATRTALTQLNATNVIIIGGTSAVSSSVMTSVEAMANISVRRFGGDDRYDTAAAVALEANAGTANVGMIGGQRTAIVGTGQDAADILAAGPLAFASQLPIVITRPGALPAESESVLRANGIQRVLIVGGTTAVSADVEAAIRAIPGVATITRLEGAQRTNTAVAIAEFAIANLGFSNSHVNLARQDVFADALAGGPHAGKEKAPILLTASTTLSPATEAFLRARSNTLVSGHIFGGLVAISAAVEAAAETAGRGTGPITLTSANVAQGGNLTGTITGDFSSVTFTGCGFTTPQTVGADDNTTTAGRQFTIAVPSSQAVGNCDVTFTFTPTGGGATTTQVVRVNVTAATSNQTFTVTPNTTETRTLADESDTATATVRDADNRTFTATGLTNGTTYRITLVNSANVQTSSTGVVTFRSSADAASSTGFSVDVGTDIADIVSVNGASPTFSTGDTESRTTTVQPVNGSITFTIDGTAPGSVTPVLYINGGSGGTSTTGGTSVRLETSATATTVAAGTFSAPVESFGVGGVTTFVNPAPTPQNLNSATAAAGTLNLTVNYQNPVQCSSVAVSDFTFTLTSGGTAPAGTVFKPTSVACTGTSDASLVFTFTGTNFSNEVGTVAVGASAVNDESGTAQAADSVAFTTGDTTDTTAPTLNASATASGNGAAADTVLLTFSEAVTASGGSYDNVQFFYDADCNGGADSISGTVAQTGTNSVTLTLVNGALPTTDDPNDCIGYVDANATAVDAGDVVDAGGNALATNSSATIAAASV